MLYRPNSEHERQVLDYLRDIKMQTGRDLEMVDVDTPQGMEMCRIYDIMDYPAIIVFNDDGHMQNSWVGRDSLPRIGEISYYISGGSA
jgi:hypothetical protein